MYVLYTMQQNIEKYFGMVYIRELQIFHYRKILYTYNFKNCINCVKLD